MSAHVGDLLADHSLGFLAAEDRASVERHLAECAVCSAQLAGLERAAGEVLASLPPVQPSPQSRVRLMNRVKGPGRFEDFTHRVAMMFALGMDRARELLEGLTDLKNWGEGPAPGVSIIPVEMGPRLAGAVGAFVRLAPGVVFPGHLHRGEELNLVLQGGFREDGGREVWPGEVLEKSPGSAHSYTALPGPDCIAAAVVAGEIELLPLPKSPD